MGFASGCRADSSLGVGPLAAGRAETEGAEMKPGALLCCAGDGALAQAAQRLWGLLLGALQQPPGRGAGHPALGVPAWAQVAPGGSGGPCQPQHLWDSVIIVVN